MATEMHSIPLGSRSAIPAAREARVPLDSSAGGWPGVWMEAVNRCTNTCPSLEKVINLAAPLLTPTAPSLAMHLIEAQGAKLKVSRQ